MKYFTLALLLSLITFAPTQVLAKKTSAGHAGIRTLSNDKLEQLAKAKGQWIHFAKFEIKRQQQHLLCRKKRNQKHPTCVVTTPKGKVLQKTVGFGRYKNVYAVGFRVGRKGTDLWLPMLLEAPTGAGSGSSSSTRGGSVSDTYGGAFGSDFSGVNVHTDGGNLLDGIGAKAIASGKDITFGGETSVDSSLLAHELTHVLTESSGGSNSNGDTGNEDSSNEDSSSGNDNSNGNDSGSNGSGNTGSGNEGSK